MRKNLPTSVRQELSAFTNITWLFPTNRPTSICKEEGMGHCHWFFANSAFTPWPVMQLPIPFAFSQRPAPLSGCWDPWPQYPWFAGQKACRRSWTPTVGINYIDPIVSEDMQRLVLYRVCVSIQIRLNDVVFINTITHTTLKCRHTFAWFAESAYISTWGL